MIIPGPYFFSLSCRCSLGFLTPSTNDVSGAGMRDEPLQECLHGRLMGGYIFFRLFCNLLGLSSFNLLFGCFSYLFRMCWKIMMI